MRALGLLLAGTVGLSLAVQVPPVLDKQRQPPGRVTHTPGSISPTLVLYQPDDVSTNIRSAAFKVSFLGPLTASDPDIGVVQNGLHLRTFPELQEIPFTATEQRIGESGQPVPAGAEATQSVRKWIDVAPAQPLPDHWLLLSTDRIAASMSPQASVDNPYPQLGVRIARLRTGSAPVIRRTSLTVGGRLDVALSELVEVDPASLGGLIRAATPSGSACALVAPASPQTAGSFDFDCPPEAWAAQHVRLTIEPGIRAPTGVALGVLRTKGCGSSAITHELSIDLDYSAVNEWAAGVKRLGVIEPDTEPPHVSASVSPSCLWPPNHSMVLFSPTAGLTVSVTDECDPAPAWTIIDVTSSQPPLGGGSGDTAPDVAWGSSSFCARSERDGMTGTARVYTVTIAARDASGNVAQAIATVSAAHDQSAPCPSVDPSRVVADGDTRCTQ